MSAHDITYGTQGFKSAINRLSRPFMSEQPIFIKMVVIDILLDPNLIDVAKEKYYTETFNIKNAVFLKYAPRNSIIAKFLLDSTSPASSESFSYILPPFFSSHLSLPLKAGEVVWCLVDKTTNEDEFFRYYWITRVTAKITTDDVNYSHFPDNFNRVFENTGIQALEERYSNLPIFYDDGSYDLTLSFLEKINKQNNSAFGWDNVNPYISIFEQSEAANLSVFEAIPRYQKRPSDLCLEGSNNTLIVLGTDRTAQAYDVQTQDINIDYPDGTSEVLTVNFAFPTEEKKPNAGSIDIVAGRGQTPKTSGEKEVNQLFEEMKKFPIEATVSNVKSQEGDPDFVADKSRIYVSQNTNLDKKISKNNTTSFNGQLLAGANISIEQDKAGILIKSDSVRLVARNDFQILIKTDDYNDADQDNPDDYCSITMKSNGEVIIKPSKNGLIKLGSESATKPIFCGEVPGVVANGQVSGVPPILTSFGSTIGTGGSFGTFSKKVLIE